MPEIFHRPLALKPAPFNFRKDKRPAKDVDILISALTVYAQPATYPHKTRLVFAHGSGRECTLLLDGVISLRRIRDDITLYSVASPGIIGLAQSLFPFAGFYLYFECDSSIKTINSTEALEVVSKENLWRCFANIQAYTTQTMNLRDAAVAGKTSYDIIANHINLLANEPESIRKLFTVSGYILQRTRLSRSSIQRIVGQLVLGGYITVDCGKLIKIRKLPLKF